MLSPLRALSVTEDARSAALYFINFHFIGEQTSYLHAGASPSPLLHFWSLAVEEQFYLVWPALLALLWWSARSRVHRRASTVVTGVVAVATLSFALSLHLSTSDPAEAYFSPFTRAWEFGLGALVALAAAQRTRAAASLPKLVRLVVGAGGLAAIVVGGVMFSDATEFPGTAALLPVLGTAAVIWSGKTLRTDAGARWTPVPARLLAARPLQAIGALSYPLYLWHWALLIVVEGHYGGLSLPLRLAVVFGSAVPAYVTMRLVERPIRLSPVLRHSAMGGFSAGVVATCLSLVVAVTVNSGITQSVGGGGAIATPALVTADLAGNPFATANASASPVDVTPLPPNCQLTVLTTAPCVVVRGTAGTLVLFGDDAAPQWLPAAEVVARDHGWALDLRAARGCRAVVSQQCTSWQARSIATIANGARPDVVLMASSETGSAQAAELRQMRVDGLRTSLLQTPTSPPVAGAATLDVSDTLCPDTMTACPTRLAGVTLYGPGHQLSQDASALLGATLEAKLEALGLAPLHLGPTGALATSGPTTPSPAAASKDWPQETGTCLIGSQATSSRPCLFGDLSSSKTVVLFGDSHAWEWAPAMSTIASQHGWRLEVYTKEGCPAPVLFPYEPGTHHGYPQCTAWRAGTLRAIASGPRPLMVMVGSLDTYYASGTTALASAWQSTLGALAVTGAPIVFLRDTPTPPQDMPTCMSGALRDWAKCDFAQHGTSALDPEARSLSSGNTYRVTVIDIDALLCPEQRCSAAVDGIEMYLDDSHITATAASAMAPLLTAELQNVGLLKG